MRIAILALAVASLSPVALAEETSVFRGDAPLLLAHEDHDDEHEEDGHDHDHDRRHRDRRADERDDVRDRKRELREERRELRERERELELQERQHRRRQIQPRQWLGIGAGIGFANVDGVNCSSFECEDSSGLGTYSANLTLTGRHSGIRLRGIRAQDKGGDQRTPYELAAMVGSRFGHSNWYGFIGAGRVLHAEDGFQGDAHGLAWEFVFAPSSRTGTGFELSFQGSAGEEVDFGLFNIGARFGRMH